MATEEGVEPLDVFVLLVEFEWLGEGLLGARQIVRLELSQAPARERFEAIGEREILARENLRVDVGGGGPALRLDEDRTEAELRVEEDRRRGGSAISLR